jgi:uncharacterized membrane protein YsdA (DUF1294 family)
MFRRHPFLIYAILFIGLAAGTAFMLARVTGWDGLVCWLIAITPVTFLAYRSDKWLATRDNVRVPERVLLLLVGIGGTVGAIVAMWFFGERHKTSKRSFLLPFFGILILQAALVGFYFWNGRGV